MACSHLAPNGEKSLLYDQLSQKYGEDKAHDMWEAIRSQQFLNKQGDWLSGTTQVPMDINSEPTLQWVEEKLGIGKSLADRVNEAKVKEKLVGGSFYFSRTEEDSENNIREKITLANVDEALKVEQKFGEMITDRNGLITGLPDASILVHYGGDSGSYTEYRDFQDLESVVKMGPEKADRDAGIDAIDYENARKIYEDILTLYGESIEQSSSPQLSLFETSPTTGTTEPPEIVSVNLDARIGKKKPDSEAVVELIRELYDRAAADPDRIYQVDYEHISDRALVGKTGYTSRELAGLFDSLPIPMNIRFAPSFQTVIDNSATRIIRQFSSDLPIEFISRDEAKVTQTAARLLIPRLNEKGEQVGFFSAQQQKEIMDTIVSSTERLYRSDPALKENSLIRTIQMIKAKEQTLLTQNKTAEAAVFTSIYNQRVKLTEEAIRQLQSLGLHTNTDSMYRILAAVDQLHFLTEQEKQDFQSDQPAIDQQQDDPFEGSFEETAGRIVRDWSENTFELDPKDTASARIKMFMGTLYEMDRGVYKTDPAGKTTFRTEIPADLSKLSKLEGLQLARELSRQPFFWKDQASSEKLRTYLEQNYATFPVENFLGRPKIADYDSIFQETLNTLGNRLQSMTFQKAMSLLESHHSPTIQRMAVELRQADKSMQNEFMVVMNKQYQPFVMTLFNTLREADGSESYVLNPIHSNRYNQRDTLINYWRDQQKLSDLMIIDKSGNRVLDVKRIQDRWLPMLEKARRINDWGEPQNKEWFIKAMGNVLRASGIGVTDMMMEDLFDNPVKWTGSPSVHSLFAINKSDGRPSGLLSIFIMKSAGQLKAGDPPDLEEGTRLSQLNNPLYSETSSMQRLARLVAKYTPVLYSSNHTGSNGKSTYDWGLNTKLSHKFRQMTQNFEAFVQERSQVDFSRNCWLLETLKVNPAQVTSLELAYLDGVKPKWGNRGTTRQQMSDREQLLTSIMLFQNRGNGFNNQGKVNYLSLTHADKTMTPVFRNMPRVSTGRYGFIPSTLIGKSDSALFRVFKSEYDRIINQEDISFNSRQYDSGKGLFYLIPDFNYTEMQRAVKEGRLTQQEMNQLYPAGQRQLTKIIDPLVQLPVINKVLRTLVDNLVTSTLTRWTQSGIISAKGNIFDKQYVQKLMAENGIKEVLKEGRRLDEPVSEYKDQQGATLSKQEVNLRIAETAAKDYAVNHFLFGTALSQLFFGDPAETFKRSKGVSDDLSHVKATMIEYNKRLAKDIAPRADLYWEPDNRSYNTITLADVKTREPYLADIRALREAYAQSTTDSTDAQELTTVQEKLDTLYAAGKIQSGIYNEMSAIIHEAGPGGYYEFTNPDHLKVILQPDKPVYAGTRPPANGAALTDYIKSSSYALYPPFTRGREMDHLRVLMETSGIQRASYESAHKIGNPARPLEVYTSEGRFKAPQKQDIAAAMQQLSRDGFGIQQEVPYDQSKEEIKVITQMNEGITEGIGHITGFEVEGHGLLDGKQVKELKERVRKKMLTISSQQVLNTLGVDENGVVDGEKILDILAAEARKKGYTINELQSVLVRDRDGIPVVSTMFSTAADKFEGLLMSMINGIADIKMPGKSYVQASSIGIIRDPASADLDNVIWIGDYDGSSLKTLRPAEGKSQAAQVILPFNFHDHLGNKLNVEDFVVERNGRKYVDYEKVPGELLELIGGRIPNQGHSSMLPLEIVGFTPTNMGDIVFIPSAVVKQMGADFDVDKLYTYKRPYEYREGRFIPVQPADIEAEQSMAELQRTYFDIHWSVLTHPQMLEKVLTPLDKDDLKSESTLLAGLVDSSSYYNFYDPMNQLEDFQRGKEGKRLVGSSSWAAKFNARIQDKDLQYAKVEFNEQLKRLTMVPDHIAVIDEHTGQERKLSYLSGTGTSYYSKVDGDAQNRQPRSKYENHTLVQSEALDNTKNRTLDPLNLTPDTYKAVQAFIQLQDSASQVPGQSWAASSKYWTRLLTQPIIWEYSRLMKQGNDSLSEQYSPKLHEKTIRELKQKYSMEWTNHSGKEFPGTPQILFSPQVLLEAHRLKGAAYIEHQLAALDLFDRLYAIGDRMFLLESQFNQDVAGAGANLFAALNKEKILGNLEQAPIMNAESLYATSEGVTEVGDTFDKTVGIAIDIVKQVFPYHALVPTIDKIAAIAGKNSITVDEQRKVLKAFRSYTYAGGNTWWRDPQAERVRLIYGNESLAKRLNSAQLTWGRENSFLSRLRPQIADNITDPDFITFVGSAEFSTVEKQNMTAAWLQLLMNSDATERKLGEDLLRYGYLTGGIQDANSFIGFAPVAYIAGTDLSDRLRLTEKMLREEGEYENDGFIIQYLQHYPETAVQVSKEQFGQIALTREYPESFLVPRIDQMVDKAYSNLIDEEGELYPFVSYRSRSDGKWILYMKNQIGNSTYYTRIDTLGNQFTDEFNGTVKAGQRSIFPQNRSLAQQLPALELTPLSSLQEMKSNAYVARNYNQDVSHFEQIGIRAGGQEQAESALEAIRENKQLPQYLREVAGFLSSVRESKSSLEAKMITSTFGKPLQIRLSSRVDASGEARFDNSIHLNLSSTSSTSDAAEVFLHEMLHNRLMWTVLAAGYDSRAMDAIKPQERSMLQAHIDSFRNKYPRVVEELKELDRLRYEALNHFRNGMAEVDFQQMTADVAQGKVQTEEHQVLYALSSLQEFVAHVPTSTGVAAYLNSINNSKGQTFLSRIWEGFAAILKAFADVFGFKVRDESILKEALLRIMRLSGKEDLHTDLDITRALTSEQNRLTVPDEATAEDLSVLLNSTYGRAATLSNTGLSFDVLVNESRKTAILGQRGRIINKLYEQKEAIEDALSRQNIESKDRAGLLTKYQELKDSIRLLHQKHDVTNIARVGQTQLKWIDEVLKAPHASEVNVSLAMKTATIWENLVNILYGNLRAAGEVSSEFAAVQLEAQKRRIELVNRVATSTIANTLQRKLDLTLTHRDYADKLVDIDTASAYTMALVRAKPLLVQGVATYGWNVKNTMDEAIYRNSQRVEAIGKQLQEAGLQPEDMIQLSGDGSSWGLINRLTHEWSTRVRESRNNLDEALELVERSDSATPEQRSRKRFRLWNDYWRDLKKEAVFVDTRIFFDTISGNRRTGPEVDAAYDQLVAAIRGGSEYASELIDRAQEKYRDYLQNRDAFSDHLDSVLQLEPEELKKTPAEQKEILEKMKTSAMESWLKYNSPLELLNQLDKEKNIHFGSEADRWIQIAPKAELAHYYDERFDKIAGDPKKKEAYDAYKAVQEEMVSYLPMEVQKEIDPANFLPIVPKDTASWLAGVMDKIRNWNTHLINSITATDAEEAARLRPDKIPVMYTYPTSITKDIGNRSTDLTRVLQVFSMMALQHKYMGSVLDTINIAESIFKEANRRRLSGEEAGGILKNTTDALKYFKDMLIFRKPKELQGKVDSPIYGNSLAESHRIIKEIKELTAEKEQLNKQIEEKMIEGDYDHDREEFRLKEINKKLSEYETMKRSIYGSKLADALISINQLKAIAWNPASAVSNFTFAEISMRVLARGRVDLDPTTLTQATGIMLHAVKRYWSFGSISDPVATKIHGLMARTGIMTDVVETDYGQGIPKRKTRTGRVLDPFNWQRSGDYYTKGKLMVAMMLKEQIEVTEQSTGEKRKIPLLEAFDEKGEWDTQKYGVNPDWDTREGRGEKFTRFRDRMRKVSMMAFGNQDRNAPMMIRSKWLGRMAGQFRLSWFPEGIATRFKSAYYDATLQREVKGRWRTYSDLGIATSFLTLCRQTLAALPGVKVDPFATARDRKGRPLAESPVDIENMRKNFAGLAWSAGFTAMILLLRALTEEDEDKQRTTQLLLNMLIRNQQDLLLYSSPGVFNQISGNFLPATQVLTDYWNAMIATGHYLLKDREKEDFDRWVRKITKAGLPHPVFSLYGKMETMMTRDLDKLNR
jgi:hypothetical protein